MESLARRRSRVLVTGHRGYVGTVLVPLLLERGYDVRGLDANLFAECAVGRLTPLADERIKDIREATREDLAGCDAIVHLAAISNDPMGDLNPEATFEINHRASVRLARLAREAGVSRFLFASSCSVYGASGSGQLHEGSPPAPLTPYAWSKLLVERDVGQLASDTFTPCFLRVSTVYGMSPLLRFDLVVNNLVAWACATNRILVKSDGRAWRPVLHVEDVARAYIIALEAEQRRVHNRAFVVGAPRGNHTVLQLARAVRRAMPGCKLELAQGGTRDPRSYRVDPSAIERELGFTPRWTLSSGIEQLVRALRPLNLTAEDLEGFRYSRVARLVRHQVEGRLDASLQWSRSDAMSLLRPA